MAARIEDLQVLLEPVVAALGYELWGIELNARPRHSLLRIYIDSESGIGVDDCAAVSRQVAATLDVADPIQGAYTLEVSSPGWERPLFAPAQFARYLGERVRLRLAHPVQGMRNVNGRLRATDEEGVELEVDVAGITRLKVPWGSIRRANLVVEDA